MKYISLAFLLVCMGLLTSCESGSKAGKPAPSNANYMPQSNTSYGNDVIAQELPVEAVPNVQHAPPGFISISQLRLAGLRLDCAPLLELDRHCIQRNLFDRDCAEIHQLVDERNCN